MGDTGVWFHGMLLSSLRVSDQLIAQTNLNLLEDSLCCFFFASFIGNGPFDCKRFKLLAAVVVYVCLSFCLYLGILPACVVTLLYILHMTLVSVNPLIQGLDSSKILLRNETCTPFWKKLDSTS